MKVIGTLDSKDDADLLKAVLEQARPLFDVIYSYDDGSIDNTKKIMKEYSDKVWSVSDFNATELKRYKQHRRGWLLEQVKKDFPYTKEEVWIVRLEGDRFFLNQTPREIVDRAKSANHDGRSGVMLDFRRHRLEDWNNKSDTFPNWHDSIRNIQRWCRVDDIHNAVAFKVADHIDYSKLNRPRPWPAGITGSDLNRETITKDMAFFEHHGRRSPKYFHWSITSGSRGLSKKLESDLVDMSSPATILETYSRFRPYKLIPWVGEITLDTLIEMHNDPDWKDPAKLRHFYYGIEKMFELGGSILPPRTDI